MKRGRPPKDVSEYDKDLITVKLSFNDIKYFVEKYQLFRPSSHEGQLSEKMANGLRQYLIDRSKKGKLPQEIIDVYVTKTEEEFIDKSTIQPKKGK